jgi:NADH-quinone oxidoreductase subunit G
VLFGVSGGVAEAVLRHVCAASGGEALKALSAAGTRNMDGVREINAMVDGREIAIAVVHGLKRADELVRAVLNREKRYDFVEVMACPGGCVGGAGQPIPQSELTKRRRGKGIYSVDKSSLIKRSDDNPAVISLYQGLLSGQREILHRYHGEDCGCSHGE